MAGKVLELRVHGVSNTPPSDLLGLAPPPGQDRSPQPHLVAGDRITGFYRAADSWRTYPVVVEAYSWGQLTSGARNAGLRAASDLRRALWTLLLPFSLANVALHARPDIPPDPAKETWPTRAGRSGWLVRLFSLSLTVTFVLAAAGVSVDLFAWQCVGTTCLERVPGPWGFLDSGWWTRATRPLVVGLALPVGLLVLVYVIARISFRYERALPEGTAAPANDTLTNPLQRPEFWRGANQVGRLGLVHLAVGLAVAAAVPLVAVIVAGPGGGAVRIITWIILGVLTAIVLLAVASLAHPEVAGRGPAGATGTDGGSGWLPRLLGLIPRRAGLLLLLPAVLALAGTALLLLFDIAMDSTRYPPTDCAERPELAGCDQDRSLPGYDWIVAYLVAGQLAVLLLLALFFRSGQQTADPYARVAWGGRAPAVLAGLGWALGMAYSAGVLYGATDVLNANATPTGASAIDPPVPLLWSAFGLSVAILVLGSTGLFVYFVTFGRHRRRSLADILANQQFVPDGATPSSHAEQRARTVAGSYALHRLVERNGVRTLAVLVLLGAGVATAGTVAALAGWPPLPIEPPSSPWWERYGLLAIKVLADVGGTLAALLPILIAGIGFLIYRNDTFRRAFGVIWDIATFWPRSAHPFAPPCYSDLVVPQLQTRVAGLLHLPARHERHVDGVILAGHSQGAVLCVATILQLPAPIRERIWLLTFGCQLNRMYGRVFPAYFGPDRLGAVSAVLGGGEGREPRWTNLWRETDPLGYPVKGEGGPPLDEVRLADPQALGPPGDDVNDPPIRGHSNYPADPTYVLKRNQAAVRLGVLAIRRVRSPRQPHLAHSQRANLDG